jgi:uncharacterized membrane protein
MPTILWLTFVGSALVILGFGAPMALGKVSPNGLYGVRLPITMRNRAAWNAANVHYGWWMIISGALSLGVFFLGRVLGWSVESIAMVYCVVMLLPLMLGLITSLSAAYRAEAESKISCSVTSDEGAD